jgi:chromosome segregation ATPase
VIADTDLQLKVWKDLALSKQLLMGAAIEAMGLDAECSSDELKTALDSAIQRSKEADERVQQIEQKAAKEIAEMKALVETSDKARAEAEAKVAIADKARETAERSLAITRSESSEFVKKAKAEVVEKQNKLKAISKALADSPENVVKKLKNLKKQKLDETKMRTQAETKVKQLSKEKATLEAELETQKALVEKAAELVSQIRSLHEVCIEQGKKIDALGDDADKIEIPALDEDLLSAFAPAEASASKGKKSKKGKK